MLTGRIDDRESYQLLVGLDYVHSNFDNTFDRAEFYDKVSDAFVKEILQKSREHPMLKLSVINGLRINSETGRNERIAPLEDALVEQFSEIVCKKLKHAPIQTMPACIVN